MLLDLFRDNLVGATPLETRTKICRMEYAMHRMAGKLAPKDLPTVSTFAPGVYIRTVFMRAGETWVGKIHRYEHFSIISQGSAAVVTEFDQSIVSAPDKFMSPAGTKRALAIIDDMIWTTIHPNPENIRDVSALEKLYIAASYTELGFEDPMLAIEGEIV